MGANSNKVMIVTALACVGVGLGAWQANEYFAVREPVDASMPTAGAGGGEHRAAKAGTQKDTLAGAAPAGSLPPGAASKPIGESPAESIVAAEPEVPTQFVKVPSKAESAKLIEDFKPQFERAVKAHAELGQATGAAQNALVAAAVEALEKILGVNGTPMDVMGERPPAAPAAPADGSAPAVASATAASPPPERAARMAGLESLLKDASIDPSRAKIEFFPDGVMGLPKRTKGAPGEERPQFQATMRMSSRMPGGEKVPMAEVRIPTKIKDSPSPGDDLDIGVMLERDESGEKWTPAGFNLHLKKPEIMKKLGGSMPAGRRQAPQTAPGGDK